MTPTRGGRAARRTANTRGQRSSRYEVARVARGWRKFAFGTHRLRRRRRRVARIRHAPPPQASSARRPPPGVARASTPINKPRTKRRIGPYHHASSSPPIRWPATSSIGAQRAHRHLLSLRTTGARNARLRADHHPTATLRDVGGDHPPPPPSIRGASRRPGARRRYRNRGHPPRAAARFPDFRRGREGNADHRASSAAAQAVPGSGLRWACCK